MYRRILVPLENSPYDTAVLAHVARLGPLCGAAVLLVHVADGWVARNYHQLDLRESEEMAEDRTYLAAEAARLAGHGVDVDAVLAGGDPATEILAIAEREGCDLIAMSTHGHGFVGDLLHGSVAERVRHHTIVPVLMVRGSGDGWADRLP